MSKINRASYLGEDDIYSSCLHILMTFEEGNLPKSLNSVSAMQVGVPYTPASFDNKTTINEISWKLVRAALWQFYANLLLLCDSAEPALIHQARIGWRRYRGTCRMLRNIKDLPEPPPTGTMQIILEQLRALREIQVARYEILPRISSNKNEWHQFADALETDAGARLDVLRNLLQDARVGKTLWEHADWLMQLRVESYSVASQKLKQRSTTKWIRQQVTKIHHQFVRACSKGKNAEAQHLARIRAKRLRYAVEDFEGLLPHAVVKWHSKATKAQTKFGRQRDIQMSARLAELHGAPNIADEIRSCVLK